MTAFAVSEVDSVLLASNGIVIMASAPGDFCKWSEVYRLPENADTGQPSAATSRILTLVTTLAPGVAYAGVQSSGPVRRVHVLRTEDGRNWVDASGGALAAATGRLRSLAVAESTPQVAYALVDPASGSPGPELPAGAAQVVFGTGDGGGTWQIKTAFGREPAGLPAELPLPVSLTEGDLQGLVVDPADPAQVWAFGEAGLLHSRDGGNSFSPVVVTPVGAVDVAAVPNSASQVLAFDMYDERRMYLSRDGSRIDFVPLAGPPGITHSVDAGATAHDWLAASDRGTYLAPPTAGAAYADISGRDRKNILDVAAFSFSGLPAVAGRTYETVEVRVLAAPLPRIPEPSSAPYIHVDAKEAKEIAPGSIAPDGNRLLMRPGETRRVPYSLDLPPAPTPLDVVFLIDISGSMDDTIFGVQQAMNAIVRRLAASRVQAEFGVGEYRSYDQGPAFRRVRDIGPVDAGLRFALQSLRANGGGEETQLAALFQSVTGGGQDESYVGTGVGNTGVQRAYIPPGQDFNFNAGSLKVIIHASDEVFSTGGPHPTYEEVSLVLRTAGVHQVGLAITPSQGNRAYGHPRDGLERVAAGSGALAPEPIDCDGDGRADLEKDQPLVCELAPTRSADAETMADVVISLLRAIEDRRDIGISVGAAGRDVEPGAPSPVVEAVSPVLHGDVDLKERNELDFEVTYRCPRLGRPREFKVELVAGTDAARLASARTTVVCRIEEPEPPAVTPLAAVPPLVAAAPPPIRPPDPAPQPNPRPQPNPNPQGQSQPQAGFAAQEQERPQLAFAAQQGERTGEAAAAGEDYRMSKYSTRRRETAPHPMFVASAAAMSLAFGFAALARRQMRTQHVRATTTRPYGRREIR